MCSFQVNVSDLHVSSSETMGKHMAKVLLHLGMFIPKVSEALEELKTLCPGEELLGIALVAGCGLSQCWRSSLCAFRQKIRHTHALQNKVGAPRMTPVVLPVGVRGLQVGCDENAGAESL